MLLLLLLLQVDASQVSIGSSWQPVLQRAVAEVSSTLGINDSTTGCIKARLYKLLLYEQGGHFSAHQDTEKERGMVGTLVVQLPCHQGHSGGTLTVRHKGRTHTHCFAEVRAAACLPAQLNSNCQCSMPLTFGSSARVRWSHQGMVGSSPSLEPCTTAYTLDARLH
jgi:hypothetical protein